MTPGDRKATFAAAVDAENGRGVAPKTHAEWSAILDSLAEFYRDMVAVQIEVGERPSTTFETKARQFTEAARLHRLAMDGLMVPGVSTKAEAKRAHDVDMEERADGVHLQRIDGKTVEIPAAPPKDATMVELLTEKLEEPDSKIPEPFKLGDITRRRWKGLTDPVAVVAGLIELVTSGYLTSVEESHGKRTVTVYSRANR